MPIGLHPSTASALPASFARDGFVTPQQARSKPGSKFRRFLLGTEGRSDTGKTEFLLSAPGPGIVLCLDRGFDAMYDNQTPPPARRGDFGFKIITAPGALQALQPDYEKHWSGFRTEFYKALENADARTVCIDGDSDSWELQRLAAHGKLHGVFPATRYTDVYAARRGFYNRAWDAGKIIIATNKLKAEYRTVMDANGKPVKDPSNPSEDKRERTGEYERQGFPDQEYLWQVQIRHLYNEPKHEGEWGLRILKCKVDPGIVGLELWGAECNFASLVQTVYPHVSLEEWGYQ